MEAEIFASFTDGQRLGVRYVGNAKALFARINPQTVGCEFALVFYAEAAGLTILGSYRIDLQGATQCEQPVPILGPYMDMVIHNAGGVSQNIFVQVYRIPVLANDWTVLGQDTSFHQNYTGIGASSSNNYNSNLIMEGPASWVGFVTGGNFAVELRALLFDGTVIELDRIDGNLTNTGPRHVYLPPMAITALVTNFTAAPQTVFLSMTRGHIT